MHGARTPFIALGSLLCAALLVYRAQAVEPAPILPDAEGRLARIVIQASPAHFEAVAPVVRSLLPRLDARTSVDLVCGRRPDAQALAAMLDDLRLANRERVAIHLEPEVETPWARDRFVAATSALGQTTLWLPSGSTPNSGDFRVPGLLGRCYPQFLPAISELPLEGGDLVVGKKFVLIGATTARRLRSANPTATAKELSAKLEKQLGRPAIFVPALDRLADKPSLVDYHLDMLATVLADDSILVGDPAAGAAILRRSPPPADWLPERLCEAYQVAAPAAADIRHRVDAIVASLREAGLKVERIPLLPLPERACLVTYNNVLQEETAAGSVVYLPQYKAGELDRAAAAVYSSRGYRVEPIDVRSLFQWQGAIRCLVNVVERKTGG